MKAIRRLVRERTGRASDVQIEAKLTYRRGLSVVSGMRYVVTINGRTKVALQPRAQRRQGPIEWVKGRRELWEFIRARCNEIVAQRPAREA